MKKKINNLYKKEELLQLITHNNQTIYNTSLHISKYYSKITFVDKRCHTILEK